MLFMKCHKIRILAHVSWIDEDGLKKQMMKFESRWKALYSRVVDGVP